MTTAAYVYGIVPASAELTDGLSGVEDAPVQLVAVDDVAALVSEITVEQPLGRPEDLQAHAQILDQTATTTPVVPLRFGAVLRDNAAVTDEFLKPNHDALKAALDQLEGRAQYVFQGRYEEPEILREILAENPDAQELRDAIRDQPEDATRDARIALGETISMSLEIKRQQDNEQAVSELVKTGWTVNPRTPSGENDAFSVAVLAPAKDHAEVEKLAGELGKKWESRINLRLLGPMAAYDFIVTDQAG